MARTISMLLPGCLFLAACGSAFEPVGPSSDPEPVNLSGPWSYSQSYRNYQLPMGCEDQGHMNVQQDGTGLGGSYTHTGTCGGPDFSFAHPDAGVLDGELAERTVNFVAGPCRYTGTVDAAADSISGSVTCSLESFDFRGEWTAERVNPSQ